MANCSENPKKKSQRQRINNENMSPIQKLIDTCKHVFAHCGPNIIPSAEKEQKLRSLLDDMKLSDVGLTPKMPYFERYIFEGVPVIQYLHIFDNDKFSIGIFCLPPGGVLPLHDHPGMTVFSKILLGTMHVKSYDWVTDNNSSARLENSKSFSNPGVKLAKMKVDREVTALCKTSVLYPADGGNLHCFTAVTACAMLDVLAPPYKDDEGRSCNYYLEHPFVKFSVDGVAEEKEGYAWLEKREELENFYMDGKVYQDPNVVEK